MTQLLGPLLIGLGLVLAGCSTDNSASGYEGALPGECSDGADNDRDGLYDCNDPDCAGSPACDDAGADADTDADTGADTGADADTDADADPEADAADEAEAETDGGPTTCDPVTQAPCGDGERCAWVEPSPGVGAAECIPDGTVELGGSCTNEPTGDDCRRGLTCIGGSMGGGTCRMICGFSTDTCATGYACMRYSGLFDDPGTGDPVAGACEPTCNPLTQTLDSDGSPNCGGPLDTSGNPTRGCYGMPNGAFACAPAGDPAKTSGVPAADPGGPVYLNSCAPGYLALLRESTDSTTIICTALCRPGDTFLGSPANAPGLLGSGYTCPDAGAGGTHECRYWWYLEDQSLAATPLSDTLGFCLDYPRYSYDSDGDGTPETAYPSCTTLATTAGTYDPSTPDYLYWGCGAR